MNIYTKDVAQIGFKGGGMFDDSKWHQFYYKVNPKSRKVYVLGSVLGDQYICHFNLSPSSLKMFQKGTLSIVPPNCCCATGNKYVNKYVMDFEGNFEDRFKKKAKFLEYLKKITEDKIYPSGLWIFRT